MHKFALALALALALAALLSLGGCASVSPRSLHPDHGPQRRAHEVTLSVTRELP